jgi:hypothetical protein
LPGTLTGWWSDIWYAKKKNETNRHQCTYTENGWSLAKVACDLSKD